MSTPTSTPAVDLASREDVIRLVERFYACAFADDLIGTIFTDVAHMDLAAHLPVMADFWETVIFRTGAYRRNALRVHTDLHERAPLTAEHFGRWLELWKTAVDDLFAGPNAELAKTQGTRIAWSMSRRLMGESGSEFVTIKRGSA